MSCCCGGDKKLNLLYSCSGSANTGYLADQVWRKLKEAGAGTGTCLSGVGADISGFVVSAQTADDNIILDGCPVGCGRKIFENKDLPFKQIILTDFGVQKGQTEITSEIIDRVTAEVLSRIV